MLCLPWPCNFTALGSGDVRGGGWVRACVRAVTAMLAGAMLSPKTAYAPVPQGP